MILKLCRDVMNLEQLIQNNTVMGALTRVLQEEYKKSVDLTFNILRYCTSPLSHTVYIGRYITVYLSMYSYGLLLGFSWRSVTSWRCTV